MVSSNPSSTCARRRGLTLLELLVVLTLLAMLAGVVVVHWSGPQQEANWRYSVDRLEFIDQQLRSRARRLAHTTELTFDLQASRVQLHAVDRAGESEVTFRFPRGCTLREVLMPGRRADFGSTTVPCTTAGITPSYALRVTVSRQAARWLVVAGVTGQFHETESDEEVRSLLSYLAQAGRHAD